MAKRRRKSNKPNLPADVLARARKNAGIEDTPEAEVAETETTSSSDNSNDDSSSVAERAARRRKLSTVQLERNRKRGELTNEMIAEVLVNPTREVTEAELREDYKHVLVDLRNMGVLAAILVVVLVGLAFNLPTF
ncbi:MAG: hypothetical protein AAF846_24440 [Chloroflexota bacterium]